MPFCLQCGSPHITTTECALRGSCKMEDNAKLARERDYAAQRGEKLNIDKTYDERAADLVFGSSAWRK